MFLHCYALISQLHIAAANGYTEVAEFLLDNHVSVDARDYESWQPIHAAAYWAQVSAFKILLCPVTLTPILTRAILLLLGGCNIKIYKSSS